MSIQARWGGICPRCDEPWQPGDLIRSVSDGWGHDSCSTERPPLYPVCQTCWLTHPEGECDR